MWAHRVHIESWGPSPSFENLKMNNYFINWPDPAEWDDTIVCFAGEYYLE